MSLRHQTSKLHFDIANYGTQHLCFVEIMLWPAFSCCIALRRAQKTITRFQRGRDAQRVERRRGMINILYKIQVQSMDEEISATCAVSYVAEKFYWRNIFSVHSHNIFQKCTMKDFIIVSIVLYPKLCWLAFPQF